MKTEGKEKEEREIEIRDRKEWGKKAVEMRSVKI